MVEESISYDNVSEAEQQVLFDAFKKSDHFLGGSEAYVYTDEKIENVSNEWRVIEIKGVPMLVSIEGPDTMPDDEEGGEVLAMLFGGVFGAVLSFYGLLAVVAVLLDHRT